MIKVIESLNIDVACWGNHDFDFSLEVAKNLSN
jgi:2',3'-cyclic-nucleotide 2'-phosphodiesterase (5'-nucleotidase family)